MLTIWIVRPPCAVILGGAIDVAGPPPGPLEALRGAHVLSFPVSLRWPKVVTLPPLAMAPSCVCHALTPRYRINGRSTLLWSGSKASLTSEHSVVGVSMTV
jgi:hypothetical protein